MNPPPLIIVTSGNDVAGHEITQYLGIVRGIIVRSTGIGRGFIGGLRSIGGGNIPEYAAVCEEAREHAFRIMLAHASELGWWGQQGGQMIPTPKSRASRLLPALYLIWAYARQGQPQLPTQRTEVPEGQAEQSKPKGSGPTMAATEERITGYSGSRNSVALGGPAGLAKGRLVWVHISLAAYCRQVLGDSTLVVRFLGGGVTVAA